jgi:aminotransferase
LRPPDWSFDDAELDAAFGSRTRAVMLNTPHNPTGKIFSADELDRIGQRCLRWNAGIVCDEIYDAFVYDGIAFCSPLQLDPLRERVVVAGGLSKSLRISGWRIGFALAGPSLSAQLRKVHDLVSLCVPVPFQHAAAAVLRDQGCVTELVVRYGRQRDRIIEMLESVGLRCYPAPGSIYLMCDGQQFNLPTGQDLASLLAVQAGVAFTPGRSCFMDPAEGRYLLRACFAKQDATLALAKERLVRFFAGSPLAS